MHFSIQPLKLIQLEQHPTMNTVELDRYMSTHPIIKPYFGGILSKDTLPTRIITTPRKYIVNMQNSNQPGDHWIVIWMDTVPEYFNSLAEKPVKEFEHFLISHSTKYKYNTKQLQSSKSDVRGQHCLMYSYFKCHGYSLQKYLNLFNDDVVLNDIKASYFYELTR